MSNPWFPELGQGYGSKSGCKYTQVDLLGKYEKGNAWQTGAGTSFWRDSEVCDPKW